MPEGHNPLGVSMSVAKRQRLVELAAAYHLPVFEDDAYGFLSYDNSQRPPLRALNDEWIYYIGSFSKILAPSLRIGWIVVPVDIIPHLSAAKEGSDLDTTTFVQHTVATFLANGYLPEHIARLRQEYRARCDALHNALEQAALHYLLFFLPGERGGSSSSSSI